MLVPLLLQSANRKIWYVNPLSRFVLEQNAWNKMNVLNLQLARISKAKVLGFQSALYFCGGRVNWSFCVLCLLCHKPVCG